MMKAFLEASDGLDLINIAKSFMDKEGRWTGITHERYLHSFTEQLVNLLETYFGKRNFEKIAILVMLSYVMLQTEMEKKQCRE
jgi:hypothetical protein